MSLWECSLYWNVVAGNAAVARTLVRIARWICVTVGSMGDGHEKQALLVKGRRCYGCGTIGRRRVA